MKVLRNFTVRLLSNGQFIAKNHSTNGTSNSSQNEKHPQDENGKFMAKN